MKIAPALIALLFAGVCAVPGHGERFAVARTATPVVNSPTLENLFGGTDGRTLLTDHCGQVRELEFIALPGTVFKVLGAERRGTLEVYRVETDDYPAPPGKTLYIDRRFVTGRKDTPPRRTATLPGREEIIATLRDAIGNPYVWGGNVRQGSGAMLEYYYHGQLSEGERRRLTLAGLDCSGLLYEATRGVTPRNTSRLVNYGRAVPVAGVTVQTMAAMLEPLDLIVWNGHVLIVLDRETVIESRLICDKPGHGGVMTTPLRRRLAEIMRTRRPLNEWRESERKNGFVVRRWYGSGE